LISFFLFSAFRMVTLDTKSLPTLVKIKKLRVFSSGSLNISQATGGILLTDTLSRLLFCSCFLKHPRIRSPKTVRATRTQNPLWSTPNISHSHDD
jgi:hypothetical protein